MNVFLSLLRTLALTLLAKEVPVADRFVGQVVQSMPADIKSADPLTQLGHVVSEAGKQAVVEGAQVGVQALGLSAIHALSQGSDPLGTALTPAPAPTPAVDAAALETKVLNTVQSALPTLIADALKAALATA